MLPALFFALLAQEDAPPTEVGGAVLPVFVESFEDWKPERWEERKGDGSALAIVDDGVLGKCLQITATLGEDTGGHLYRRLDPGLDTCFLRFYVRFEKDPGYLHHFVHLVGYRPSTPWPQGGAGERPKGDERFTTGIEPTGNWGRHEPPGAWNFYSYWCEMKGAPDGKFWGNSFMPDPPVLAVADRWTSVEIMLKVNSAPDKHDGEQALWIDGQEAGRWGGFRWSTHSELNVNGLWMLYYVTEQPDRLNRHESRPVQRVWFDEIVVDRKRIGPLKLDDD